MLSRSGGSLHAGRVLSLCVSLIFAAGLAAYPAPQNPEPANPKASSAAMEGRKNFESHCAVCHGLDGRGGEHAHAIATPSVAGALETLALIQIIRGGIPSAGMPSFSSLSEPEIRGIVAYLRVLTGQSTVRPVKGNSAQGEQLFFGKGRCGDCHMMLGKCGFLGSDLTGFSESHSVDEIHQAIIHPDQGTTPAQKMVTVTTQSGDRATGLERNEDNFSLQVQDADGIFHLFMKSQIAKIERAPNSLMPEDYGTRLTAAELDDLINFLFSGLPAPAHGSPGAGRSAREAAQKNSAKTDSK